MTDATVTVHFQQRFGAFDRISSLLRRRGFPIAGITVERTQRDDVGRMSVGVRGEAAIEQVRRHLEKLPDVLEVQVHLEGSSVRREYALVRLRRDPGREDAVLAVLAEHGARVVNSSATELVAEASGSHPAMDTLFAALAPYGIEECARTNTIALSHAANGESQR